MLGRPSPPLPADQRFVARRLASAEGVLAETLERLQDPALAPGRAMYATREVERAAARVRYWRELQRRDATHPRLRTCKMLGHSWVTTSGESISAGVCRRCGARRVD